MEASESVGDPARSITADVGLSPSRGGVAALAGRAGGGAGGDCGRDDVDGAQDERNDDCEYCDIGVIGRCGGDIGRCCGGGVIGGGGCCWGRRS